jgi:uncharacterized protein involved in outer membrane biogenesis
MRRAILIIFLALLVLFTVIVGGGWYLLHDEAFLKSQLSSQTLKYTGRGLVLNGPVRLSLGRDTTLEARDVHFANPPWADQADMASAGHLLITINLPSIFSDKIIFPALVLDDCAVTLLKNDAGEANWQFFPGTEKAAEPEKKKEPRKDLPVRLKDLKIHACQLNIASPKLNLPLDIKVSDLAMQHSDDSRWAAKGSGTLNEQVFSLDGWFAPFHALILGGPLDHDMNLSLGEITLQSSGSIQDAASWTGANLTTHIQGPEIEEILEEFKLPVFSEGPFDYSLRLNTEGKMTRLDLDGDLGTVDIKAQGELDRLIRPTSGELEFSVDGPNLGALARIFGIEDLVEDAFSHQAQAAFKGDAIHFKKAVLKTESDHLEIGGHFNTGPGFSGTELDIHFETREFGRWMKAIRLVEQNVGPLTLDGKLSSGPKGLLSIQSKAVHGPSTLDVEGTLGHLPDALAPDLKISLNSPDPTPLALLLGLKNFPAAALTIEGQFGLKDKQIKLDKVDINLAGNLANIDGILNLENRYAGSDVVIGVDIQNAGELGRLFGKDGLPDQPVKLSAEIKPDGKGLAFQLNDGNLGKIQVELSGRIADLEHPLGIDGNFDINLPRLSDVSFLLPDQKLPDAPFSARGRIDSQGEKILIEKLTIKLAENKANIDGYIKRVDHYSGSRLNVDLDIKNAGNFGRMFGKDGLPDQPLKLTVTLKPEGRGLAFKMSDGNLGEIQLDFDGKIADLDRPTGVDANFDIKLPKLSDISFLLPGWDLPDAPFTANGRLANHQTRTRLDQVQLVLGQVKASIDGNLLPDNHFRLSIKATGPDASRLDGLASTSLPPEPFSLAAVLDGSPSEFELSGFTVNLGKSQVGGDLMIGLGDIKQIKGKIDSPYLDLSHWYTGDQPEEEPKPASQREWKFDDTPVMTFDGHGLDIGLDLKVDELFLGNTSILDIKLGLVLSDKLLRLDSVTYRGIQGGSYLSEFSLDGTGAVPKMHFELNGKDVRLGLTSLPDQDPSTVAPIEVEMNLDGVGATRRELASSLNGKSRIYLGSGLVANAGFDLLFSDFLTQLASTLNPFAKTSEYTKLDCAVIAADAESGVVKVFPVIFHTEQLTILSDGVVDLNTEKIDLSFNTKPRTGIGLSAGVLINPMIKVGGRLTAPAIEMDPENTIKSGGLAVATLGISVLAKSFSNRFLSSPDPCGEARKELEKIDNAAK